MIEIKYRPNFLHFALRCDPQLTYCIMAGSRLSKQDEMMAHYKYKRGYNKNIKPNSKFKKI